MMQRVSDEAMSALRSGDQLNYYSDREVITDLCVSALVDDLRDARAEVERLRDALGKLDAMMPCCPVCGNAEKGPRPAHEKHCFVGKALARVLDEGEK